MTRTPSSGGGIDEILALITMPVIGLTICPGFLLCVPGLLMVILPIAALGLLALAAGLVIAAIIVPLFLARALVRRAARSLAAPAPAPAPAPQLPAPAGRALVTR